MRDGRSTRSLRALARMTLRCTAACVCFFVGYVACSGSNELHRGVRPVNQIPDSGTSSLPEATTTGETKIVVLPDGGTVEVTSLPDGAVVSADGAVALTLEGGLTGSVFSLRCDTGAIVVSGQPKTIQCAVLYPDGSTAQNVVWLVQDTMVGSIGADGVFRANGWAGGVFEVSAKIGDVAIKTKITVDFTLRENPDGVSDADISKLVAGGSGGPNGVGPDGELKWLYPFDKTVFPRGLPAPEPQLGGSCSGSMGLKITAPHFLYERFVKTTAPARIDIPEPVWKGLTLTAGASDWVSTSVSRLCAGQVTGPVNESWLIAPGNMKGVVYYTRYVDNNNAASGVMRLPLGGQAQLFRGGCTVCHSVSANGEVLASGIDWRGGTVDQSGTFDLTTGAAPPPSRVITGDGLMFAHVALTPDGTRAFTSRAPSSATRLQNGMDTAGPSSLVDTATAQVIPTPSLSTLYAQTPSFSPDGRSLAFNNSSSGLGHLGILDFDATQSPPVFSNVRDVTVHDGSVLSWPSFLPDSGAIIYQDGDWFYSTKNLLTGANVLAQLRMVEVSSGRVTDLQSLNGYLPDGSFYLPWGAAEDDQKDYQPTVLPRPIGGYYWVMFSSRRGYGNTISPGGTVAGGDDAWGKPRKKIWVAAIDIDYPNKLDASHPAFYLPGQELDQGSIRPFVSLEPCRPQGASCESGADCCDGFCRETGRNPDGTPVLECVPPPVSACSNLDEACITAADCCDPTLLCIIGRCSLPTPIIR